MRQRPVDLRRMVATKEAAIFLIALLAVVGHVDDDGIFVGKTPANLVDNRVVVAHGVVIVGQNHALLLRKFGAQPLIAFGHKLLAFLRIAVAIVHVLPNEMEEDEVGLLQINLTRFEEIVVILQQTCIVTVERGVAQVKLGAVQRGVVEKESATKIKHRCGRLHQELVGEERHLVARFLEDLGEKGIVAPFAWLPHDMHREHVFKHIAREVPRCNHVGERHQEPSPGASLLPWRGGQRVTILMGVVLAIAFANDEHDGGRAKRAAVNAYLVGCHH